jgi:hypothetical protein
MPFFIVVYYFKVIPSIVNTLSNYLPPHFMPTAKSMIKPNVVIHSERQPIAFRSPSIPSNPKDEVVTRQLLCMSPSPPYLLPVFAEP